MKFLEDYWGRFENPRRYTANEEIEVRGVHAEASMYWQVTQEREGQSVLGWGAYEWGLKCVDERWQITKEVVHILAMTTLEEGWAGDKGLSSI